MAKKEKSVLSVDTLDLHRKLNLGLVEPDAATAMKLAVGDPDFAQELVKDPEKFAVRFNLEKEDIAALRDVHDKIGAMDVAASDGYE